MKSHVQVAVIGGGVVGCSVLYHLTKAGWTDVALFERSELTSGSSWHAAGGFHTINGDPNVAKLQAYTVQLYDEIEKLSGQSCGLHLTGGLMLAATSERLDWLRMTLARGRYLDMDLEEISPKRARELFPLMDDSYFVGAVYDPYHGHLDPSGTTHAYAGSARANGAEIYRQARVEALTQNSDGSWQVIAQAGTVRAEHVVNAGGLWAREVGRLVGLELPVLAMEHMYLLTEDMPEVAAFNETEGKEVLHVVDFDGELYLRQEAGGMLMGTYEKACVPWSEQETPWDFGQDLLPSDLDRIAPSLEVGFEHFPAFKTAGIKQVINGPFTFAPDGNPLIGPVRGLTNFWCACGVMAGFSQGGGVGLALANWITEGDPGFDVWAMDVARYGDWTTMAYTNAKVRENYSRRFSIQYPNEELPAARPYRTTPVYDIMIAHGAVMGDSWGLEVPLWFASDGVNDCFSWRRSTDFDHVGAECRAVRDSVGMMETSNFAKYDVSGPGARDWLDRLLTARLPEPGRICLAPMLNERGKLIGDFTVANLGPDANGVDRFFVVGTGAAEVYHMRWFEQHRPADGSVDVRPCGLDLVGLSLVGPNARDVLTTICPDDVSAEDFKFMDIRESAIGMAPVRIGRISYTGDLGFEVWMRPEYQRYVFETMMTAGAGHGIKLFGSRALNGLRLEKNYGSWGREYRPIYGPYEAGLGGFVALTKDADFIGKSAAMRERSDGGSLRLRTFLLQAKDADVIGDEPIWFRNDVRGWVTSGGYAHAANTSVAMGYVPKDIADEYEGWEIELLGERLPATLQTTPLFDHNGQRMRG